MSDNNFKLLIPLIKLDIYPDENPITYLTRLAYVNQYASIIWLIQHDLKVPSPTYALTHDLIISTQWMKTTMSSNVTNQCHISPTLLNRKYLKYCPACLQEANYYRMSWQLKTSLACLKHQLILSDGCPKCCEKIPLISGKIGFCQCGYHLAHSPTIIANQYAVNLQNFIEGHHTSDIFSFFQEDIELLTISDRIAFIIKLIGSSIENVQFSVHGKKDWTVSIKAIQSIADTFFSTQKILSKYFLELSQIKYIRRHGSPSAFTVFYRSFFNAFTSRHFHVYKGCIESFIIENYNDSITLRNSLFNKDVIDNYPWITLKYACYSIKAPPSILRRAIKEKQLLSIIHKKGSRNYTLIYRESLKQLEKHLADLYNFNDTRLYLGVTKKQLYELLDNNMFPQAISPQQGSTTTWRIPKKDLDQLHEELAKLSQEKILADLTFGEATRIICGRIPQDFFQLLQAILNQDIPIRNCNTKQYAISNFKDYRISRIFLEIWIQGKIMQDQYYTIPQLAKYLRINQESAYQLVNFDLIEYEAIGNTRLITQQHLDTFTQRYIVLSHYAKTHNTSSRYLMNTFANKGVYPIDQAWDKKLRQKIYIRKNILTAIPYIDQILKLQ